MNVIATLEDVKNQRSLRKKGEFTGQFKATDMIMRAIEKLKRGVDECDQLAELNPKCAEKYWGEMGLIASEVYEFVKRSKVSAEEG